MFKSVFMFFFSTCDPAQSIAPAPVAAGYQQVTSVIHGAPRQCHRHNPLILITANGLQRVLARGREAMRHQQRFANHPCHAMRLGATVRPFKAKCIIERQIRLE